MMNLSLLISLSVGLFSYWPHLFQAKSHFLQFGKWEAMEVGCERSSSVYYLLLYLKLQTRCFIDVLDFKGNHVHCYLIQDLCTWIHLITSLFWIRSSWWTQPISYVFMYPICTTFKFNYIFQIHVQFKIYVWRKCV